jgi:hypothetical protein
MGLAPNEKAYDERELFQNVLKKEKGIDPIIFI